VQYNYNNNNYVVTRGNDYVDINISSGVVYTDLNSSYAALDGASEITLQTVLLVSVLVCLGFSLLCRILFRRIVKRCQALDISAKREASESIGTLRTVSVRKTKRQPGYLALIHSKHS
jgi:hypothetical protein